MPDVAQKKEPVTWSEDLSKAIVPVKPVKDCLLIVAWASMQQETLPLAIQQEPLSLIMQPEQQPPALQLAPLLPAIQQDLLPPSMPAQMRPLSLPTLVTKKPAAKTPLVDTLVRRSPRINPAAVDGFQVVPVKAKASALKRARKLAVPLDLDKKLPSDVAEVINPTSLETIKEWALSCGVAPEELSEEALLQGRAEDSE
jgi:hypothetical protein